MKNGNLFVYVFVGCLRQAADEGDPCAADEGCHCEKKLPKKSSRKEKVKKLKQQQK